jgi:acetylglutamate kinase
MKRDVLIVYLDAYNQADPIFRRSLARAIGVVIKTRCCVVVHGGGEGVERRLEAEGSEPVIQGDLVIGASAREEEIIHVANVEANHRLAGDLTEELVPVVGLQGSDRGILRLEGANLAARSATWLTQLLDRGVAVVVSALATDGEGGRRSVSPAGAASSLARALADAGREAVILVFRRKSEAFTGKKDQVVSIAEHSDLEEALYAPASVVSLMAERDIPVYAIDLGNLLERDSALWTRVVP